MVVVVVVSWGWLVCVWLLGGGALWRPPRRYPFGGIRGLPYTSIHRPCSTGNVLWWYQHFFPRPVYRPLSTAPCLPLPAYRPLYSPLLSPLYSPLRLSRACLVPFYIDCITHGVCYAGKRFYIELLFHLGFLACFFGLLWDMPTEQVRY